MSSAHPEHFIALGRLPKDLMDSAPWPASACICAPAALIVSLALVAIVDDVDDVDDVEEDVVALTVLLVSELGTELLISRERA